MLQLFNKICMLFLYIYKVIKYILQILQLNTVWSILVRLILIFNFIYLVQIVIYTQYYPNIIIKKYNLDYIPPKPSSPGTPSYFTSTTEALQVEKNISNYKDVFITLSKLHNIYIIITSISLNKKQLELQISSKIQEGLYHYIDSLQQYLPKYMIIQTIKFNNLKVKGKGGKKKKKKRKKRLTAFQKFMLKKGATGGLVNPKNKKKGNGKIVDYDFSCVIKITIKR